MNKPLLILIQLTKEKNRSLNYIALSNMTLLRWLWPNWKPSLTLILKHFLLKLPGQKKRRCQHHLRYLFSAFYRFSASNLYFNFAKIVKSFQRVDEQTTEKYRELERYCLKKISTCTKTVVYIVLSGNGD